MFKLLGILLLVAVPAGASAQSVLYVDDDAPLGGDGTSWDAAFRFVQDALTTATALPKPLELRVAGGTYRPDNSAASPAGTGDRNAVFQLQSGVTLRGGYAGLAAATPAERDARDPSTYPSVFDGDLKGDDGPAFANSEENVYQLILAHEVDATAVLDGFTLRNARADGISLGPTPASKDQGAAVNVYHAQPLLLNCIFERCWMKNHGTVNDHGSTTLIHCTFRDNYSEDFGAGLYTHFDAVTIAMNCRFERNVAVNNGGGMYVRSGAPPPGGGHDGHGAAAGHPDPEHLRAVIHNCEFFDNVAFKGAGLYVQSEAHAEIAQSQFARNVAHDRGGGAYYDIASHGAVDECDFTENTAGTGGGLYTDFATPNVTDCDFVRNEGNFGEGGGGAWIASSPIDIIGCRFIENSGFNGGGLYNGGEVCPNLVRDCEFIGNTALNDNGAGMSNVTCGPIVENCLFEGNVTTTNSGNTFVVGGGVSSYLSAPTFRDCVFRNNSAILGAGGAYNEGGEVRYERCAFYDNTAENGGAMYNLLAVVTLENCLFARNEAAGGTKFDRNGGAVYNSFLADLRVDNCTFADNSAQFGGAIVDFAGSFTIRNSIVWNNSGPDALAHSGSVVWVEDSIVQGGWSGDGDHNTDDDPLFIDPLAEDYGLAPASPAIDAGNPATTYPGAATDLAGGRRIANCLVDRGAYEVQTDGDERGDVNLDGVISVGDIGAFVDALINAEASAAARCRADLNNDGAVTVSDIAPFVARLTQ